MVSVSQPATLNQDFVTYAGDQVAAIFQVVDSNGNPVDISGVTQITWVARVNLDTAAVLTKTKTGGSIAFVTTGTDGKFTLTLLAADTNQLSGFYLHYVTITTAAGAVETVAVGRLQCGLAPAWTYNPAQLTSSSLYQVRLLIGDVLQSDQLLMDSEINYFIGTYSNVKLAAYGCCLALAEKFARQVDVVQGNMKTNYSAKSRRFQELSRVYKEQGYATSVGGYAGGISASDVQAQDSNTDRIQPQFTIGMADAFLPVGDIGVQAPLGGAASIPAFEAS